MPSTPYWQNPDALKAILSDVELFSRYVIGTPLYPYQINAIRPIIRSALAQAGREHLLVFPRQSGKNEAIAQLIVYLLNLLSRQESNIVYAAIGDGIGRGMHRLEERLDNRWNRGRWRAEYRPTRRILGKASVTFLSSHPQANARGETAHHLLVIDELQDNDASHLETVFTPMRAANNASAVYLGTVRTSTDALWQKRTQLEEEEQKDGIPRVFLVSPEIVTADNSHYASFLAAQVQRYGASHPIVASEYYLQPIDSAAALFPPARLTLLHGRHARQQQPSPGRTYLALLDVAGQDEGATDIVKALSNPARDYTVCTIVELDRDPQNRPTFAAVDVFIDHGSRHFQTIPGRPMLAERLLAYLQHWNVTHTITDAAGVGEGLTDWLTARLGSHAVSPCRLDKTHKAALGNTLLSLVETNRLKYWTDDEDTPLSDGWWFWQQAKACQYSLPLGGLFDRDLRFSVPTSHATPTPAGLQPTHDDRLMSLLLAAEAQDLLDAGKIRAGTARSEILRPYDPISD
jgi:hypothetical protein